MTLNLRVTPLSLRVAPFGQPSRHAGSSAFQISLVVLGVMRTSCRSKGSCALHSTAHMNAAMRPSLMKGILRGQGRVHVSMHSSVTGGPKRYRWTQALQVDPSVTDGSSIISSSRVNITRLELHGRTCCRARPRLSPSRPRPSREFLRASVFCLQILSACHHW